MPTELIDLSKIALDGGTQMRVAIDYAVVQEYADALDAGQEFPPVVLYHDGAAHWLAGGFHRYHAAAKLGRTQIKAEVRKGSQRDAQIYAAGDNAKHGLRRLDADKRKAVNALLDDPEWSAKTTAWIAETCSVSWSLVEKVRQERAEAAGGSPPAREVENRKGRDGRHYPAKSGKSVREPHERAGDEVPEAPPTSAERPAESPAESPPGVKDAVGKVVPDRLRPAFASGEKFRSWSKRLGDLLGETEVLAKQPGGERIHLPTILTAIRDLQRLLRFAGPYAVCPKCQGKGCPGGRAAACAGLGWVRESDWKNLPDKEPGHAAA